MASAADVTFKDVVREACLSRDHFMAWTDGAGSADAAAAQMSAAARRRSGMTASKTSSATSSTARTCRDRDGQEIAAILDSSSKSDQDQATRLREALVFSGAAQVDEYLGVFLTEGSTPAQIGADEEFRRCQAPDRAIVRRGSRPARSPDRKAPRGHHPRPHRRRCCTSRPQPRRTTGAKNRSAACSTMTI